MKVLAVDTASKSCSVSIVEKQAVISELTISIKETHARHLMGMIETVMRLSHLTPNEIDGYAVSTGPGSFTGIRIGMSTIKGLSGASGRPVAGVSSLTVLAYGLSHSTKLICSMLDARRGEVYFSHYKFQNNRMKQICPEQAASPAKIVSDIKEPCIFVGDGSEVYKNVIQNSLGEMAYFANPFQNTIKGSIVGKLGFDILESREWQGDEELKPYYIRKCDAEINKAKISHPATPD